MTLTAEHIEPDTRERILVVAERLFRQIGYQKTTVADIAKELRMSPANVYRFFDSKKAIHEGVARTLMGGVEIAAQSICRNRRSATTRMRSRVSVSICSETSVMVLILMFPHSAASASGNAIGALARSWAGCCGATSGWPLSSRLLRNQSA